MNLRIGPILGHLSYPGGRPASFRSGVATGFQFDPGSADALRTALERAFALYRDKKAWRQVQRRAMGRNVDWSSPAKAYAALYRALRPAAKAAA